MSQGATAKGAAPADSKMTLTIYQLGQRLLEACRIGQLSRLRRIIMYFKPDLVSQAMGLKVEGATCLVTACRKGHLAIVKFLVGQWSVSIEQTGMVSFDGEKIEGAPPLWAAAAAGHLDIVEFLVSKGANLDCTTLTNSTPLRAACYDGHYKVVKFLCDQGADIEIANRHGHTCLMISCYKGHKHIAEFLLDLGSEINRKSVKGNTALHDCAEAGQLSIMCLLLERGARQQNDFYGLSPLMSAAAAGHWNIVEHLISLDECTRPQKVDALELLGATWIDRRRSLPQAKHFWRNAFDIRFELGEEPLLKPAADPKPVYLNNVEVKNVEELEQIWSEQDAMYMQSLLVRERILGPKHPDTSYFIRYRAAVFADNGNYERCIEMWLYALHMQREHLEPLVCMTQSSYMSFAELFSCAAKGLIPPTNDFTSAVLVEVLEIAVSDLITCSPSVDTPQIHKMLQVIIHMMSLVCRNLEMFTEEQKIRAYKQAHKLLKTNIRGSRNESVLHIASSALTSGVMKHVVVHFPCPETIKLFVGLGADPDEANSAGDTPLHLASSITCKTDSASKERASAACKALLDVGAHSDYVNKKGRCFWEAPTHAPFNVLFQDWRIAVCNKPFDLRCLAARSVAGHPQLRELAPQLFPPQLVTFITKHGVPPSPNEPSPM